MYAATTPELYGFATLASIILLFLSGLETNLRLFLKYSFVGLMVGIGGVLGSFVLGNLCAVYLLPEFFEKFKYLAEMPLSQAMVEAAPMYMGIMSTATSVGITARILSERKKMDSEEGVSIMAGAVIDDVLGLIVLAIGNGIIAATLAAKSAGGAASAAVNWSAIGMVAVKAFGVWLGATLIGVVIAKRMSWLLKLFKSHNAIATLAFGLAMILAGFFECMGLAMIIGAYVMGLALSRTDLKHMIQETLAPVYTFLVPIFFCVMGMMVDCSALMSKPVLIFGAIYTVLAVFAKIAGCALPSLFCGFNLVGSLRIGAGMIPRGEVALIIAGLGLSNGYLSQEVFGIGIMMTLITTVVAPPMLVGLFNIKCDGIRGQRKTNTEGSRPFSFQLASVSVAQLMVDRLVKVFQKEGFFTHLLNAEENIWAIQMDDFEISMCRDDDTIRFECTPEEESLVMTAWMEVVGEIRDIAQSIAKPVRQDDLEALLKDESELKRAGGGGVSRYVQRFVMLPGFKATSKNEAIEKMIDAMTKAYPQRVTDVAAVKAAVFAREASMPTGLDCGIAVPHGRTDAVTGIIGAVAIIDNSNNENGSIADYETIDHSAIQIIVLTVAPETAQTPYLQLMAFISRALRANNGYEKLVSCKNEDEMRRFFHSAK
jgi:Kef-type K+ transport system membrane component KefB/mannitol/fructose-specific phosphotransferase system IIA component (Ntr-type)